MQILRRLLLFIVFIALLLNAFLYWATEKEISKRKALQNKTADIKLLFIEKADAEKVSKELRSSGISAKYEYPVKDFKEEPAGYIVVQEFPKQEAFKSIKNVITAKGFRVKEEDTAAKDKFRLYVGSIYDNKNEAFKFVEEVYTKTIIKFNVETYYKKVPFNFYSLTITDLTKDKAKEILDDLQKKYGNKCYIKTSEK